MAKKLIDEKSKEFATAKRVSKVNRTPNEYIGQLQYDL